MVIFNQDNKYVMESVCNYLYLQLIHQMEMSCMYIVLFWTPEFNSGVTRVLISDESECN